MSKELEQNIERIEKELAELKAELAKSKKFEWKYPYDETFFVDRESIRGDRYGDSKGYLHHGRYRLSKQYAEHSLERNRVGNRLEALVEQIEPDYVVPSKPEMVYCISTNANNEYYVSSHLFIRYIGQVYMSEETAIKICELLNSGEVTL